MNKILFTLYSLSFSLLGFAQEASKAPKERSFLVEYVGQTKLILLIGLIFFIYSYKNSIKFFAWVEDQTIGTRDYVLEKCELLFIEIDPMKLTYVLLFLTFGLGIIVTGIFALMGKFTLGVMIGIVISIAGWKAPRPIMDALVNARIRKYEDQMVDALNLLSNGLRAGLSVPQSIGMVVDELPKPVSQEFNQILQQTKIGLPLDEAFGNLAKRIPTEDNDMFVSSVNILRETGGNLAEVFDTIANVIRERVRLKQKINTYVSQGKMQGGLILSMPYALGAYFGSTDPQFTHILFGTIAGNILVVAAFALNLVGGFFMWKVIQIKA